MAPEAPPLVPVTPRTCWEHHAPPLPRVRPGLFGQPDEELPPVAITPFCTKMVVCVVHSLGREIPLCAEHRLGFLRTQRALIANLHAEIAEAEAAIREIGG